MFDAPPALFNTIAFNAVQLNGPGFVTPPDSFFYFFAPQASARLLLDGEASISDSELYRAYGEQEAECDK